MKVLNRENKVWLTYSLWILGIAMIIFGSFFNRFHVLDKPLSKDAAIKGVRIKIYSEAQLTSAVSTDKVVLTEEGLLQTVPGEGYCVI